MINHPLYNRINRVVATESVNGSVDQRAFDGIRNQASVRTILATMDYVPNCETRPTVWMLSSIKKAKAEKRKRASHENLYDKFAKAINDKGYIYLDEIAVSKAHAQKIASRVRCDGMKLSCIMGDKLNPDSNRRVLLGYKLDE